MKILSHLFAIIIFLAAFSSCSKNNTNGGPSGGNGQITIHLFSKTVFYPDRCEVDPANSEIDAAPIVRNDEIKGYSRTDHQFFVSQQAFKRLEKARDKTGFVVALNGNAVYYGVYKPFISSSSCDQSITLSGWIINNNYILDMNLGYPGALQGVDIPDLRNQEDLIKALQKQGKLK